MLINDSKFSKYWVSLSIDLIKTNYQSFYNI